MPPLVSGVGFSTLGCPEWSFAQAVERADAWGADLIEIRFFNGRTIAPDVTSAELREARTILRDARVRPCTLATGIKLASGLAGADDLRRMIDIASELGCGQIRVFPGGALDKPDLDAMAALVHASIDHAIDRGVRIGVETHDSVKSGLAVAALAARLDHPAFGIVWDMVHTAVTGESPLDAWRAVCSRVIEVQVKDARLGPPTAPVLLGDGDVDWRGGLVRAVDGGFRGPFVLEWEKAWHPELAEPEIAIPFELAALRAALPANC